MDYSTEIHEQLDFGSTGHMAVTPQFFFPHSFEEITNIVNYVLIWPQDTFNRAKKWVQELQRQGETVKLKYHRVFATVMEQKQLSMVHRCHKSYKNIEDYMFYVIKEDG